MRPDFHKIVAERGKCGGGMTAQHRRANNDKKQEHLPLRESMSKIHKLHWNGKERSYNTGPLYRYLFSQVGRPWDDVFSEMSATNDSRSITKSRVLEPIDWWKGVEKHVNIVGKQAFYTTGRYGRSPSELQNNQLYVDDSGILRKYKRKVGKKKSYYQLQEEKWMETTRNLPNGNQARKINSIWFEIVLSPILDSQIMTTWGPPSRYTLTRYATHIPLVNDVLGLDRKSVV